MSTADRLGPVALARWYFALQAVAGLVWWALVFTVDEVRVATLGDWSPQWLVVPDLVLFAGASAVAAAAPSRAAAVVAAGWTAVVTIALAGHGLTEQTAGWGVLAMSVATIGSVAAALTLWMGALPRHWFFVGPFSFRPADPASGRRHLMRSLTQVVVFWTTFFLLVPAVLAWAEQRLGLSSPALAAAWIRPVVAVVFLVAAAGALWACVTMSLVGRGTPLPSATARELVVAGPYRWVRNPMALAGVVQTACVGLWFGSWLVVAVAVAGGVVWNVVIRPGEEADMASRFGQPYLAYTAAVRCWIPTRPGAVGRS